MLPEENGQMHSETGASENNKKMHEHCAVASDFITIATGAGSLSHQIRCGASKIN